ncbi:hypothetical protein [Sphingomicrobium astaxanthinifaciens]|uniref:hypothetical protein n=1 Tax=Sphingomicrobium astaxanthinifaciens TaxID=1227949 RepID=UPI001FCBB8B4|nr:hypothetical protein [Sphingomicrobium astaxanthinifaciens]MCJ7422168.1 hypothetical protein [Sphingomicrobium astaxanthinifaciens]
MALGALIGANGESEEGRHALVALGGRPLIDLQVRALAAQGVAPIVIYPEAIEADLEAAVLRLKGEGLPVVLVGDALEAAARFSPEDRLIVLGDGIVPAPEHLAGLADLDRAAVVAIPDSGDSEAFERIDLEWRWAGLALTSGEGLRSTAKMVGDWDLVSTLLRRMVQARVALLPVDQLAAEPPLRVATAADARPYEDRLRTAARGDRRDWVARYLLVPVEQWLADRAARLSIRPALWQASGLVALLLVLLAIAIGPWWSVGLAGLVAFFPDLVARQVARRRLQAEPARWRRLRRLAGHGLVLALAYRAWPELGWGAVGLAAVTLLLAVSGDLERQRRPVGERVGLWLWHWRPMLLVMMIGIAAGQAGGTLILLALLAAASFLFVHRREG